MLHVHKPMIVHSDRSLTCMLPIQAVDAPLYLMLHVCIILNVRSDRSLACMLAAQGADPPSLYLMLH